jgi:uncharacterized Zn-finger protein
VRSMAEGFSGAGGPLHRTSCGPLPCKCREDIEVDCPAFTPLLQARAMQTDRFTPEISYVATPRVACDGASETHPALGHPRVYLQIDEKGFVDCGYCDKRFVLKGGAADEGSEG